MSKSKTYMKRVFSGKEVPSIGMDQGKGKLYGGNGVDICFNLLYDGAMETRAGQSEEGVYEDGITLGVAMATTSAIITGTNVYAEET